MKKATTLIAIMALALSIAMPAMAEESNWPAGFSMTDEDQGPQGNENRPKWRETGPPWWTFFNLLTGMKQFSSDWKENSLLNIQFCFNIPSSEYNAESTELPPFFWAFDYSLSAMTLEQKYEEYSTHELHLGLRRIMNRGQWSLYWGGGLALVYGGVDTLDPNAKIRGNDYGAGYWIGAGFEKIYLSGTEPSSIGFSIKYSDVNLSDLGVNGGGLYLGITLGSPIGGTLGLPEKRRDSRITASL